MPPAAATICCHNLVPPAAATIWCQLPACSLPTPLTTVANATLRPIHRLRHLPYHAYATCRKPRRSSKQSDQKTGASTTRERGSRNPQRDEDPAEAEGYSKVGCTGQQRSASEQNHKPTRRISPICSDSSHANEPVQDEQPLSPAQLIKADMQRQQDYGDDEHRRQ